MGSSTGSAAAVAEGLARAAVGTETDGSVTMPAAACGLVGLKPTHGALPSSGVVPVALGQDTCGPISSDVRTAWRLFLAMKGGKVESDAGEDGLDEGALRGKRIGVARPMCGGYGRETERRFQGALDRMKAAGATLVEVPEEEFPSLVSKVQEQELDKVLAPEFKEDIEEYLRSRDPALVNGCRTLKDLIQFNSNHPEEELALFGQELFELADKTNGRQSEGYEETRDKIKCDYRFALD